MVGGGLPVGVYGGRADVMRHISPLSLYQAGTLSGNPLATAAGLKTIEVLRREVPLKQPNAATQLADGLAAMLTELGVEGSVERVGTMLTCSSGLRSRRTLMRNCDHEKFGRFHRAMLDGGVYLPPSGEAWFVSRPHRGRNSLH